MRLQPLLNACVVALARLLARITDRHGRPRVQRWVVGAASFLLPPSHRADFRADWEENFYEARDEDVADWIFRLLKVLRAALGVAAVRWSGVIRRAERAVVVVAGSVLTTTLLMRSPSGAVVGLAFGASFHSGVLTAERGDWLPGVAGAFARRSPWSRRALLLAAGLPLIPSVEFAVLLPVLSLAPRASVATQLLAISVPTGLTFGALLGLAYRDVPTVPGRSNH